MKSVRKIQVSQNAASTDLEELLCVCGVKFGDGAEWRSEVHVNILTRLLQVGAAHGNLPKSEKVGEQWS